MRVKRVNVSNQGSDRAQLKQPNELVRIAGKARQVSMSSDSLALCSKAKELDQLASTIDQSRMERLHAVREALKSGTYEIPAADVAERLIDTNSNKE
jgi:flagellar biosynthesis anti-sigma factor FlgM